MMASLSIEEVDHLKISGFIFDRKLTWSNMIEHMSTRCWQRLGALYRIKDYLGPKDLAIAFKAFVRPVCEYGNVVIMGASPSHLSKPYKTQKQAERLVGSTFPTLHSRRCASAIGLLCKVLDLRCREPLQLFCLAFVATPVSHSYYLQSSSDDCLLLLSPVQHNSLWIYFEEVFWYH